MGTLRDALEQSLKDSEVIRGKSEVEKTFLKYEKGFKKLQNQIVIWTTSNNINLKAPQVVMIERPYQRHVLVKKQTFNVDGVHGVIRFSVSYASLISGSDKIETLE